jgi:Family of unknown function (DUF6152)
MNRNLRLSVVAALMAVSFCGSLWAHHGNAAYADTTIQFKNATVTKFLWQNPHSILMFDVRDDKGAALHWAAEIGSPSALTLHGWNKNSVQPGDMVDVYMFAAKNGIPVGRLSRIVFPDGKMLHDSQNRDPNEK